MTEAPGSPPAAGSSRARDERDVTRAPVRASSVLPGLLDMRSRAWFAFGRHQPACVVEDIDPFRAHREASGSSRDARHTLPRP